MKQLKNKKTLAFIGLASFALVFAGTIAYNRDSITFNNDFTLDTDISEFSDTFDSPSNWTPCTTTPKTAIATNKAASNRYVRMKIDEYWRTANSATSEDDHTTTDLPLTWTEGNTAKSYAIINMQNEDKWLPSEDGWYYYKTALGENESTDSLLESVTFNCEVNTAGAVTYAADGKSAYSTPTAYGGAKYHIYVTFQMSSVPFN